MPMSDAQRSLVEQLATWSDDQVIERYTLLALRGFGLAKPAVIDSSEYLLQRDAAECIRQQLRSQSPQLIRQILMISIWQNET